MKLYYTITEVSHILELPASKIRFWIEQLGISVKVRDGHKCSRRFKFRDKDILTLSKAKELSDTGEYTLKGIKNRL